MRKRNAFGFMFLAGYVAVAAAYADAVTDWNANAGKAAQKACLSPNDDPLHESRMYAMTHIAIHDALNAIDYRYRPYAFRSPEVPWASRDAAIATAARDVLVNVIGQIPAPFPAFCIAAGIASVEADYTVAINAIMGDPSAKAKGIEIGHAAAAAILEVRTGDGSDTPLIVSDYPQGEKPGEYRFTDGFNFAFAPGWGSVKPFVLGNGSQFFPPPPYTLGSSRYLADFNEVKLLGGDGGPASPSARTKDQTEIALFWIESSPLQWNRIARTVSAAQGFDAWENARLFGLLNMAMADGYIASFEAKYRYNFWRPVTAIRMADADGNPQTEPNALWTPLAPTPPIPDHDSGHSVQGSAAAQVLRRVFGKDAISFKACSLSLLPATDRCDGISPRFRNYSSFTQAEEENGFSRILVGFHFRKAVDDGAQHGHRIADRAVTSSLRPVR